MIEIKNIGSSPGKVYDARIWWDADDFINNTTSITITERLDLLNHHKHKTMSKLGFNFGDNKNAIRQIKGKYDKAVNAISDLQLPEAENDQVISILSNGFKTAVMSATGSVSLAPVVPVVRKKKEDADTTETNDGATGEPAAETATTTGKTKGGGKKAANDASDLQ